MLGEVLNEGFTKFLTAIDAKDVMGGGYECRNSYKLMYGSGLMEMLTILLQPDSVLLVAVLCYGIYISIKKMVSYFYKSSLLLYRVKLLLFNSFNMRDNSL